MFEFLFKNKPEHDSKSKQQGCATSAARGDEVVFKLKADAAPSMLEIDIKFMGMLMGINSLTYEDLKPHEIKALAHIESWSEQDSLPHNLVPRLPSVIPKIMMAVRDDQSTAQDLANLISEDVSLVGEVIRLSNSAYYRTGEKIDSLKQAIVKLGLNGIRQLISSAAFKPILNPKQGKITSVLSQYLWEKNQKAAMGGNFIAMHTEDDRFHAYLTCLLSQTGILVIIKQLDDSFNTVDIPRSSQFMHQLDSLCKLITVQISRQWEMPEEVTQALQDQLNERAPAEIPSLGSVCFIADKLAKMSILEANGQLDELDQGLLCHVSRIKSQLCNQCYKLINLDQQK